MAEVSSTPDLRDPLGAPQIVTGPEYMHALASLGYNVENMTSMLPTITKIAESGTSFMDNAIKQRQDYLKSQADLTEVNARAAYTQSEADYNNRSMQLRLDDLDLKNKSAKNALFIQEQTMAGQIAAENARTNIQPQIDQNNLDKSKLEQQEIQDRINLQKQATERQQEAQSEEAQLYANAPRPEDPDYFAKRAELYAKYPNAIGNELTKGRVEAFFKGQEEARTQNAVVQKRNEYASDLQKHIDATTLPRNLDVHAISNNFDAAQKLITRGNINGWVQRISSLIASMPKDLDPEYQTQLKDLTTMRDRMLNILRDQDNGMEAVTNGAHSDLFDSNGTLAAQYQGDIAALEAFQAARAKRAAAEYKPDVYTTTAGASTATGEEKPVETKVETQSQATAEAFAQQARQRQQAEQEAAQKAAQEAAGKGKAAPTPTPPPLTDQQKQQSAGLRGFLAQHPEYADLARRAQAGSADDNTILKAALRAAGVQGFQAGGTVDDVDATQSAQDLTAASLIAGQQLAGQPMQSYQTGGDVGSTDTVPAMLTPGEFVINQPAAQAIGLDALNRLNAAGSMDAPRGQPVSNTPNLRSSFQPLASLYARGQGPGGLSGSPLSPLPAVAAAAQTAARGQQPTGQDTTGTTAAGPGAMTPGSTGQQTTANPDINTVQQGVKITQYGYPGDATWDSNSGRGIGDRENSLQPGVSVALTQSMRRQLFPDAKPDPKTGLISSTGKTFTWNGRTYRDDDTAPEADARIDVYNPSYTGVDRGVSPEQIAQRQQFAQLASQRQPYQAGGPVYGYSPAARALGGNTPSIAADLSTLPEGNPLYSPSTGRQPVSAPGFQRGGPVGEGSFGGRGRSGGSGDESIFGGGTAGGGGGDGWLPQQKQKRRRFHPKLPGQQGPDIPDEMQKKLAKLSHDYLSGLSGIIQQRPEMGAQLLRHARNQLAANLGTGAEDEEGQQQQDYGSPDQQYSPAAYAMTAQMGEQT